MPPRGQKGKKPIPPPTIVRDTSYEAMEEEESPSPSLESLMSEHSSLLEYMGGEMRGVDNTMRAVVKSLETTLARTTSLEALLERSERTTSRLMEQIMTLNGRVDQLVKDNQVLTAENRFVTKEVASLRTSLTASPSPVRPPPPPPPNPFSFSGPGLRNVATPRPTTPPPQPKRKRDVVVGSTPRKPTKQPRDTSPPTQQSGPAHFIAQDPPSPTPTGAPATTVDQPEPIGGRDGWTEVKGKRRIRKEKKEMRAKSGGKVPTAPKGKRRGQVPTWAQVAQGGGIHIHVHTGGGDPKPTQAPRPRRRRSKGKKKGRKADGSAPEEKEAEGMEED